MANQDYQSIYRGPEMDDRWGKAGTAVQGIKINGTESQKDSESKVNITLDRAAVGLGNVDNTADADKPVSTEQEAAITSAVATERTRAVNKENALEAEINAEASRAQGAESALAERVSTIEGKEAGWDAKQNAISDLATIRSNASAGKTASDNLHGHTVLKDVPADAKFTDTVYDDTGIRQDILDLENGKQDNLSDAQLANIAAVPSIEESVTGIQQTMGGYGDIVTHDADEFATAEQGGKADTALQPTPQTLTPAEQAQARENIDAPNKDGYYEQMGVGYAKSLLGNGAATQEMIDFRASGGTKSIGTGVETIKTIKGNSVVLNQLCPLFTDFRNDYNASQCTYENNGRKVNFPAVGDIAYKRDFGNQVIIGHKYFYTCKYSNGEGNTLVLNFNNGNGGVSEFIRTASSGIFAGFATPTINGNQFVVVYSEGNAAASVEDLNIIDLTQMFGTGNEPTSLDDPRIKWIQRQGYIPYTEGQLLNYKGEGLKTIGVNQCKEDFSIEGNWNVTSLFPVIPGVTYYGKVFGYSREDNLYYDAYDANGQHILDTWLGSFNGQSIVFGSEVAFIRLKIWAAAGEEITFDSVQLALYHSGGATPTTYHPYEEHTLALPITSLKANGVTIFPDGLKSAGTAHDKLYGNSLGVITKAGKWIGVMDLGESTWIKDAGDKFFELSGEKPFHNGNLFCAKYALAAVGDDVYYGRADGIGYLPQWNSLLIRDTSLLSLTAAEFKAAMSGVMLYYELEEPVEYTLDTPINTIAFVEDWGTEMNLPQGKDTQGLPLTTPLNAEIVYAPNVQDEIRNLPKNYISKESMEAILNAFKAAGIVASFTLTFDETSGKYNCAITAPTA